jgi:hypothetical protein
LNAKGINATLDHLGEHTSTAEEASNATEDILAILSEIDKAKVRANVSIKLTQIGMGLDESICRQNLIRVLERAKECGNFVRIDIEDTPYSDVTIAIYNAMLERGFTTQNMGMAVQSYLYRAEEDVRKLLETGTRFRLVKGAYKEPADKAFPKKADTDANYDLLTKIMIDANLKLQNNTLSDDGLRINFPLSPLRINYSKIKGAGKMETSLGFRLFGGSLPGSHWGRFTTSNLGSAQVYATKYKGEFVLLELTDGEKILLSPLEPDSFLEALRGRTAVGAPIVTKVEESRLDRRLAAVQIMVLIVAWLAFALYVASVYPSLPEVIPVHFGLDGVPNRFGSKVEMLWLVGLSALFPTLNAVFVLKYGKYNRRMTVFLGVVFLLAIGLFAFVFNQILSAT